MSNIGDDDLNVFIDELWEFYKLSAVKETVNEEAMEMRVKINRGTEALYKGHCSTLNAFVGILKAGFLYEVSRNGGCRYLENF